MAISQRQQLLRLSQKGVTFTGVEGAPPPPRRSARIINDGLGLMAWTISTSTLSGGNWLSVAPSTGSADASSSSSVEAEVDPFGLAPGNYYGLLEVAAPEAASSPQFLTVVLNLLSGESDPGPIVTPTGLIFIAPEGGPAPKAQQIRISNLTADEISFTVRPLTLDGDGWLMASPDGGAVAPGDPTTIGVQADSSNLSPGIYRGLVRLLFQDGLSRTVDVILVVVPNGPVSLKRSRRSQNGCSRSEVAPVFQLLGGTAPIPAGWPAAIEVLVVDDCGSPIDLAP